MKVPMMSAVRFDGSVVRVEQVRRVRPATGQVLVRVTAVAIDRADGESHTGPRPVVLDAAGRRILGRYAAGTVAALGVGVDGWALGRSVAIQPEVWGHRTSFVPGVEQDGVLADYVVAPVEALVILPPELPASVTAQLPLAARAASMLTHARLVPGESVGVWGAGALGCAAVAVARALGAAPIIVVEPRAQGRAVAHDLGADAVLDPADADLSAHIQQLTGRRGLGLALHAAPDDGAAAQALTTLGPDGRGLFAGPTRSLSARERWDGRTLSGVPRLDPAALERVTLLAAQGRLRLPVRPSLPAGLVEATELLNVAVRGGAAIEPCVVSP